MGPAELDDRELGYIDLLCSALFFLLDSCFLLFLSSFFSFFLVPSSSILAPSWLILAPSWAILAPQRPPQASSSKRGLQKLIVFWSKTRLESGGHKRGLQKLIVFWSKTRLVSGGHILFDKNVKTFLYLGRIRKVLKKSRPPEQKTKHHQNDAEW